MKVVKKKGYKITSKAISVWFACVTISSSLLLVSEAKAKEASNSVLEELIVTARKREENLQDTPISVTAFSAEGLENRGLQDISGIGDFTPNMTFDSTSALAGTSSASSIYIRGVGQSDWALPLDPGVGLYLDGVYIARSVGGVLDLLDLERVEVLRGPQGTLFGRNTIGGAVSLYSTKPDVDSFFGKVLATVGDYNKRNMKASFNIPLGDTLAANIAISSKKRDGYVENRGSGTDLGDEDSIAGRIGIRWMPIDDLTIDFAADYSKEREAPSANVLIYVDEDSGTAGLYNNLFSGSAQCADYSDPGRFANPSCFNSQFLAGPYKTYSEHRTNNAFLNSRSSTVEPKAELNLFGYSLTAEWQINDDLTLKSITAYRESKDGYWSRDFDHAPDIAITQSYNNYEQDQFTQELQLMGTAFDEKLNWIVGAYWFEEEGCHEDVVELPFAVFDSGGCIDNESKALFGQATYDITDRLHATLGLRWTDEAKKFSPRSMLAWDILSGTDPVPGFNGVFVDPEGNALVPGGLLLPLDEGEVSSEEVTPYVNVAYDLADEMMVYVSYSEGFKGGAFTQRVFPPLDVIPSADPEFVTAYEIGFKSTLADGSIRLNAAYFYSDYEDIQVNSSAVALGTGSVIPRIGTILHNAADGTIQGVEVELTAVPTDELLIEIGLGWLDAEYKDIESVAFITENSHFVNTPDFSGSLGVSYTIPVFNYGTLTPRIDYSYTSKVYNDAGNTPNLVQGGYGVVNASLSYRSPSEKVSVTLSGYNLGDKEYLYTGYISAGDSVVEGVYGMPRYWDLTLRYNFGK